LENSEENSDRQAAALQFAGPHLTMLASETHSTHLGIGFSGEIDDIDARGQTSKYDMATVMDRIDELNAVYQRDCRRVGLSSTTGQTEEKLSPLWG